MRARKARSAGTRLNWRGIRYTAKMRIPMAATQIFGTLAIIVFLRHGWWTVLALVALWLVTFRKLSKRELLAFLVVNCVFTLMDVVAVAQGTFRFESPVFLGLPAYEPLMWGFYVLHILRTLGGPPPSQEGVGLALGLAIAFGACFALFRGSLLLFAATAVVVGVCLWRFRENEDRAYFGYAVALGALFEYAGVWSGQWSYPGGPPGGVPIWFVTLWGGVGLFVRRLLISRVYGGQDRPGLLSHEDRRGSEGFR